MIEKDLPRGGLRYSHRVTIHLWKCSAFLIGLPVVAVARDDDGSMIKIRDSIRVSRNGDNFASGTTEYAVTRKEDIRLLSVGGT